MSKCNEKQLNLLKFSEMDVFFWKKMLNIVHKISWDNSFSLLPIKNLKRFNMLNVAPK
jgi:hypothetical protein